MALLLRRRGAGGTAGPPSAKAVDAPRSGPLRGEEDDEVGPRPNPLASPVWSPSTRTASRSRLQKPSLLMRCLGASPAPRSPFATGPHLFRIFAHNQAQNLSIVAAVLVSAAFPLSYQRTSSTAMDGWPIEVWNEQAPQMLILFSFALQIFLFLFAWTRRRGPSAVLKILLWLAYLMADSTAMYTLGHLSISGWSSSKKLVLLWVPFLLVHLGSQDSISAYALEDSQLWRRHMLNLVIQITGASYVVYKHGPETETSLLLAALLMFTVATIKYTERIRALKAASLGSIRISMKSWQPLPTYGALQQSRGPRALERDDEELLLFAQALLPVCKGAMTDWPISLFTRSVEDKIVRLRSSSYRWNWNLKDRCKLVEMELSLMYDFLYTKAAVIHTWYGYSLRLISLLGIVAAFLLFQVTNKRGFRRIDVTITYILFVGALFLDMASVFRAMGSTWSCNFLWNKGWSRPALAIMSLRRLVKAGGHREWPGSIGQYNLFHVCSRDMNTLSSRMARIIGGAFLSGWIKWHYCGSLVIPKDVKELVFQRVWQVLKEIQDPGSKDEIQSAPYEEGVEEPMVVMSPGTEVVGFGPELYEDTFRRRMKLDEALGFGAELQQAILTWHVLTYVFLLCSSTPNDDAAQLSVDLKAIKALSDYMVFLVAIRPNTIPGLELRSLYEATSVVLEDTWRREGKGSFDPSSATREEKLASILQNSAHEILVKSSIILSHGTLYAKLLLELVDTGNPDKSGVMSSYEDSDHAAMDKLKRSLMPDLEFWCRRGVFDMPRALALILDTWVRLLIFASVRCSRDTHASQMNCGGELTTVIWLMEEHSAMFLKQPPEDECGSSYGASSWYGSCSSRDPESAVA